MASFADAGTPLFWVGWFVALCSTTLQNVGLFMLKKAHLKFLGNNGVTNIAKQEQIDKANLDNDIISKAKKIFSKKNKNKQNANNNINKDEEKKENFDEKALNQQEKSPEKEITNIKEKAEEKEEMSSAILVSSAPNIGKNLKEITKLGIDSSKLDDEEKGYEENTDLKENSEISYSFLNNERLSNVEKLTGIVNSEKSDYFYIESPNEKNNENTTKNLTETNSIITKEINSEGKNISENNKEIDNNNKNTNKSKATKKKYNCFPCKNKKNSKEKKSVMTKSGTIKYWENPAWWIAFVVFIIGVILDLVSLSMLPASLTLPIGSFGLIISAICSSVGLGERFTPCDGIGTALLVIGSCLTIIFIPKERGTYDISLMLGLIKGDQPGLYWCLAMGAITLILTFIVVVLRRFQIAILAAILPGCVGLFLNIFGKICSESLLATFKNDSTYANAFEAWEFYVFVLVVIFVALMQNHWLQRGLCLYDNMIIVPGYFVSLMICNCLNGVLFFQEFTNVSVGAAILFAIGIVVVCIGCILISISHNSNRKRLKSSNVKQMIQQFSSLDKQTAAKSLINKSENLSNSLKNTEAPLEKIYRMHILPTSAFIIYEPEYFTRPSSKSIKEKSQNVPEAEQTVENEDETVKNININIEVNKGI